MFYLKSDLVLAAFELLLLPIFIAGTVSSAEITLDRIAIIVGDGVVLESQVNKMLNTFNALMLHVYYNLPQYMKKLLS